MVPQVFDHSQRVRTLTRGMAAIPEPETALRDVKVLMFSLARSITPLAEHLHECERRQLAKTMRRARIYLSQAIVAVEGGEKIIPPRYDIFETAAPAPSPVAEPEPVPVKAERPRKPAPGSPKEFCPVCGRSFDWRGPAFERHMRYTHHVDPFTLSPIDTDALVGVKP